jgi:hypothetical protein
MTTEVQQRVLFYLRADPLRLDQAIGVVRLRIIAIAALDGGAANKHAGSVH